MPMKSSKVFKYLEQFDTKERTRFGEFVRSPYFNKHEKTKQLLNILMRTSNPVKQKVFEALFPGENYDDQKLGNVMSYLTSLLYDFLAIKNFQSKEGLFDLFSLDEALSDEQNKLFEIRSKQFEKETEKRKREDNFTYYQKYYLNNLVDHYEHLNVNRGLSQRLQNSVDYFDVYYFSEKLKLCAAMLVRQKVVQVEFKIRFLDAVIFQLESDWEYYKQFTPILIYFHINKMLTEESGDDYFFILMDLLEKHISSFSVEEGRELYTYAQNFCISKINKGEPEYLKEIFKIYQQLLKRALIFSNNTLSEWHYKNIITVGCRLKKFDWTFEFIETYKQKLPASQRENAYRYNLASFYLTKGDYNQALTLLNNVEFTDVFYSVDARFVLMKAYYAMGEYDLMISFLDTFRLYLMRNKKVSTSNRKSYLNSIRLASSLAKIKLEPKSNRKEKLEKLKIKLEKTDAIVNKQWLLAKSKELFNE